MNPDFIGLRNKWLQDLSSRKKAKKKNFFSTVDNDLAIKKDEIFFQENPEKIFFKYRSLNQYTLDSITNSSTHLSSPRDFNDPFDTRSYKVNLDFKKAVTQEEIKDILINEPFCRLVNWKTWPRNKRKAVLNRIKNREDLENFLKNFLPHHMKDQDLFDREMDLNKEQIIVGDERLLIGCFSSLKNSMLMWSHYANYHQGICIGYDYEGQQNCTQLLYPVSYQQEFGNVHEAKLIKHVGWSYEHEWRIIVSESMMRVFEKKFGQPIGNKILKFECCKIYLGVNFRKNFENKETRELATKLLEIAKIKNIPVRQMRLRSDKFELYDEEFVNED